MAEYSNACTAYSSNAVVKITSKVSPFRNSNSLNPLCTGISMSRKTSSALVLRISSTASLTEAA